MRTRQGCSLALAGVFTLALAACVSSPAATDPVGHDGSGDSQATPTATVAAEVPTGGAFFLDLRTGTQTSLPSTSVENDVAFDKGYYYAPSPDGSRIYWESPGTTASAVASSDGSKGRRLDPTGAIDYYAGGWSPDGTKIVYQRRDSSGDDFGNLVVEDIASGRTTRITDLEQSSVDVDGWWYLAPTFSSDGRNVIFQWPRASSSGIKWALWSVPATGGEPTVLVKNAAQATTFEGLTYAFVRPHPNFFDGSSLLIAEADGVRKLVDAKTGIFEPKMAPDGSKIAYQDGGFIYVVDVSTGEKSKVAEGRMAAWVDDETLIVAPDAP